MAEKTRSRVLLVVFGIVAALLALEAGMRLWLTFGGSERDRLLYLYDRAHIDRQTALFTGVPYLNYTLNPNLEDIDARGVRGERVAVPKPVGVYRIVALGGSTTFGHALSVEEAWPAQLQDVLREDYAYDNVEVVNLGVPGYYSLDSVVNLATRGLALEPDLVMSYDGLNDAVTRMVQDPACYTGDTPLFGFGADRGIWQTQGQALPPSALVRFVGLRLGWMADPTDVNSRLEPTGWCPPEQEDLSRLDLLEQNPPVYFERNLRSIAALAQSGGAEMLFSNYAWDTTAAQAVLDAHPDAAGQRALMLAITEQNALTEQIAADVGALYVDLASEMNGEPYFQPDQLHQTPEGSRLQAEIYAAYLDAQGLIPHPD